MTKSQIREHKMGNQRRKLAILTAARSCHPMDKKWWARRGLVQDGRHTAAAKQLA